MLTRYRFHRLKWEEMNTNYLKEQMLAQNCREGMKIENRELISISPFVDITIDEVMEDSLKRAFIWANEMGLKGVKVSTFSIEKGDTAIFGHPRDARHRIMVNVFIDEKKYE